MTGPRQVGKTTFLRQLAAENAHHKVLSLNCDEPDIRVLLENVTSTQLRTLVGNHRLIMIDEAQKVDHIGSTLNIIFIHFQPVK